MGEQAAVTELKQKEQQRRLSREDLIRPKIVEDELYIPRLGGTVKLRTLSQERRRKCRDGSGANTQEFDEDLFERLCIVYSVVDPELTIEDVDALVEQDVSILNELNVAIQILNSLGTLAGLKNESSEIPNSDSV